MMILAIDALDSAARFQSPSRGAASGSQHILCGAGNKSGSQSEKRHQRSNASNSRSAKGRYFIIRVVHPDRCASSNHDRQARYNQQRPSERRNDCFTDGQVHRFYQVLFCS